MTTVNLIDVTAVICARNSEKLIARAINSLLDQGLPASNIIVVDGESVDQTVNIARTMGCLIYSDEGKGFVAARSLGVDRTETSFCLILGPDDALDPGSVLELKRELSSVPNIAAVAARKRVDPKLSKFLDKGMDFYYRQQTVGKAPAVGNPTLYKTNLLKKWRYDSRFSANEDTDWCFRIRAEGYEILRSDKALSLEFEPLGWKQFTRRWLWYGEGDFVFVSKYISISPTTAIRHLIHPAREYIGRLGIKGALSGNLSGAIFVIMCGLLRYMGFLRRMVGWLAGKRFVGEGR
jgi:glycosyltransferase involved in cell wall biosynthesis